MGSKVSMEEKEKQIGVAVEFLKNPKIKNETKEMKISFLSQKGLNDEMIAEAFDRYQSLLIQQEVQSCLKDENIENKNLDLDYFIQQSFKSHFISIRGLNLKVFEDSLVNKLSHLKVLIVNNNPIKKFPEEINKIKNLQVLQATNCLLTDQSFPENFYELDYLENLNISNNTLHQYKNFEKLKNIKIIVLKNNEISNIVDFVNKSIEKIYVQGNPFIEQNLVKNNKLYIL